MAADFPILFFAPPGPVEAIFTSGLLRRLCNEVEGARFTIVASERTAPLYREVPGLEAIVVHGPTGAPAAFRLWRRLRRRRWGLVLDPQGGRSAPPARPGLSRAPPERWPGGAHPD